MIARTNQLPLTRRLLGQYLLFGCASIATVGMLLGLSGNRQSRQQDDLL